MPVRLSITRVIGVVTAFNLTLSSHVSSFSMKKHIAQFLTTNSRKSLEK